LHERFSGFREISLVVHKSGRFLLKNHSDFFLSHCSHSPSQPVSLPRQQLQSKIKNQKSKIPWLIPFRMTKKSPVTKFQNTFLLLQNAMEAVRVIRCRGKVLLSARFVLRGIQSMRSVEL